MNITYFALLAILAAVLNGVLCWSISSRHAREDANLEALAEREQRDALAALNRRTDVVNEACRGAFVRAEQAWRDGDLEQRRFWLGVQSACGAEIGDLAIAIKVEEAA